MGKLRTYVLFRQRHVTQRPLSNIFEVGSSHFPKLFQTLKFLQRPFFSLEEVAINFLHVGVFRCINKQFSHMWENGYWLGGGGSFEQTSKNEQSPSKKG